MKIIHGKDYYDTANYGIDPDIIFVRDSAVDIDIKAMPFKSRFIERRGYKSSEKSYKFNLTLMYVFFGGDVYPCMRLIYNKRKEDIQTRSSYDNFSRVEHDLTEWVDDELTHYTIEHHYDYDSALAAFVRSEFDDEHDWFYKTKNSQRIYDHFQERNPTWSQWLIANKVVTGYYIPPSCREDDKPQLRINGDFMKDLDFYKVKDAFTANQDLANYVGGVLPANANPMIELDNKHKIMKAGFDLTTSFRKGKTKHLKRGNK